MAQQSPDSVWLTFLGQTLYENLNPLWAFCQDDSQPLLERLVLLHAVEAETEANRLFEAVSLLSARYRGAALTSQGVAFDDEDVPGFRKKSEAVFETAVRCQFTLILDLSPTTWSYVPIHLMQLANRYRDRVCSVRYLQYAQHRMRHRPYPLIPRKGLVSHELLDEFAKERRETDG